jgi:hypothetical protein
LHFVKLPGKEMVGAPDPMDLLGLGERIVEDLELARRPEFISGSLDD